MKWLKFSLTTTNEAIDIISAGFSDIGIEGIEIEDNIPLTEKETKGMFIDILPTLPKDNGIAKINFYLEEDGDTEEILKKVNLYLDEISKYIDLGPRKLEQGQTQDKDWINNWKEFFKPFIVGDILIKPTWEDIPKDKDYKLLIQIDPGTAFGTGSHETTKLCIMQLEKYIKKINKNDINVLDIGTGSGILGVVCLKLGAKKLVATEVDENTYSAIIDNIKNNDISMDDFDIIFGNIIEDENIKQKIGDNKYDICVANILAPIIILLQKEVARYLKKGAIFITSGIIDLKVEEVKRAFEENKEFEILEINKLGEWYNITARKI